MDRVTFLARSETFGFDTPDPWALPALRLLCSVPRAYQPLVDAWELRHPGTVAALDKMTAQGFVAYQSGVVIDTTTGTTEERETRKVPRYRTTASGHALAVAGAEDLRVLEERFPRTAAHNMYGVLRLLEAFDLNHSHVKFGLSSRYAAELCGMAPRTVKWWVNRLVADKYLALLPVEHADVREVVPAHWRVKRSLSKQLNDVLDAFAPDAAALKVEFRLGRTRYLDDIDPARRGISGATDFDHDVECQRVLAALFSSETAVSEALFNVEPRFVLTADTQAVPAVFGAADDLVFYQPDAEIRERSGSGIRRSVIEYERYQSRRDAWGHIERFLAYLWARTLPMESAVLRFVVDSKRRERAYVELIQAFADYAIDYPERMPPNAVTLAVSSVPRVLGAEDPLSDAAWFRIQVPGTGRADTTCVPVLHPAHASPYDDYFARGPVGS